MNQPRVESVRESLPVFSELDIEDQEAETQGDSARGQNGHADEHSFRNAVNASDGSVWRR